MRTRLDLLAGIACVVLATACGVHQTEAPPLSGPSTLGQSVSITATPDSLTQNGASQSAVKVLVNGPDGKPLAGRALRLDMSVGGTIVDYGTLSTKSIVTAADGSATSIYTAPPAPPAGTAQDSASVSIVATLIGSDAQALVPVAAAIRLVPPGVILPPTGTPSPAFRFSPTSPATNTLVLFDASGSCGAALVNNACPATADAISSYSWNFGDGSNGTGVAPSHTYTAALSYLVTLTVTTTRGAQASATQTVAVSQTTGPTAAFVFSPAVPSVGQTVQFNADQSKAAIGHSISQFNWNFGDGTSGSGLTTSHVYTLAGAYNVTLAVIDDTGQKATTNVTVTVSTGNPVAALGLIKTGGLSVQADAGASTASGGASIVSYSFIWGDGTPDTNQTTPTAPHTFAAPVFPALTATYSVTVRVTDSATPPRTGTATASVTVP
jgi:PKD repeat protein